MNHIYSWCSFWIGRKKIANAIKIRTLFISFIVSTLIGSLNTEQILNYRINTIWVRSEFSYIIFGIIFAVNSYVGFVRLCFSIHVSRTGTETRNGRTQIFFENRNPYWNPYFLIFKKSELEPFKLNTKMFGSFRFLSVTRNNIWFKMDFVSTNKIQVYNCENKRFP